MPRAKVPPMLRIFTDSRCARHTSPPGFPERRERLDAVLAGLRAAPWEIDEETTSGHDIDAAVAAVHDERYIERFRAAVERRDGLLDSADNPLSEGTWEAARAAVRASLRATDWVLAEPGRAAFAAIRPPGHHGERAVAMGFCYFNNVAVAAEHVIRRHGIERVAILDFDVHHGNGTQHIFEERPDVLYVSCHQAPFYPGTGAADETGRGAGAGATLNVPMTAGCGDEEYQQVFGDQILPGLRRFEPGILLISAGFDAWRDDLLGGMRVTLDGYRNWGTMLGELAGEICDGRTVSLLEGGYDLDALGDLAVAYLEGLEAAQDG